MPSNSTRATPRPHWLGLDFSTKRMSACRRHGRRFGHPPHSASPARVPDAAALKGHACHRPPHRHGHRRGGQIPAMASPSGSKALRPGVHQCAPFLEETAARVGRLDLVPDHVHECRLHDRMRRMGPLGRMAAEARSDARSAAAENRTPQAPWGRPKSPEVPRQSKYPRPYPRWTDCGKTY